MYGSLSAQWPQIKSNCAGRLKPKTLTKKVRIDLLKRTKYRKQFHLKTGTKVYIFYLHFILCVFFCKKKKHTAKEFLQIDRTVFRLIITISLLIFAAVPTASFHHQQLSFFIRIGVPRAVPFYSLLLHPSTYLHTVHLNEQRPVLNCSRFLLYIS